MLTKTAEGKFTADPRDVMMILFHLGTKRFHLAFFEWKPLPGEMSRETPLEIVRLRSTMHHTEGSDSFEGALRHLADIREKIILPDANVALTHAYPWSGDAAIWVAKSWQGASFQEVNPGELPETLV